MDFTAGIIGFGKLGSTLAEALADIGRLEWIVDMNEEARYRAREVCNNIQILKSTNKIEKLPEFIFLTVYDSAIEETAEELSVFFKARLKDCHVIHCSGALPLNILKSCKAYGAKISSIHPYQTFYYPSKDLLKGIGWSIQSEEKPEELIKFIEMLGGHSEVISDDENITSLYHCSAVVASNFLSTLLALSGDIAQLANINPEKFIPPIVKTTIENNLKNTGQENEFPLTGPFARGDIKTIERHIQSLKPHPHLLKSYCYLGLATIEKTREHKLLEKKVLKEIEVLLKKDLE